MNLENELLQKVFDETEILKNNQFIYTCDETGIKRFEQLLGINNGSADTLEHRRDKVLSAWNMSIPYTYKNLVLKLNMLCSEDGYFMYMNNNNYTLDIYNKIKSKDMYDSVTYIIDKVVPCNICTSIFIDYNRYKIYKPFMHKEMSKFTNIELREKFIEESEVYLNRHNIYSGIKYKDLGESINYKIRRKGEWF